MPTPMPTVDDCDFDGYSRTEGACRGGNSPGGNAGLVFHRNRNCKSLCDGQNTCTGYVLPKSNSNWCETYKSVGAKGDGRNTFWCYMKGDDCIAPTPMPTNPPTPTPPTEDPTASPTETPATDAPTIAPATDAPTIAPTDTVGPCFKFGK